MRVFVWLLAAVFLATGAVGSCPAFAQSALPASVQAELKSAWEAAGRTAIRGPAEIKLLDQANLKISKNQVFIPATEANRIMAALGNSRLDERYGLIVSDKDNQQWIVDIVWTKEGYVRDGDAKEWQSDALLENLKKATDEGNIARTERGLPALDVIGWVQEPAYDNANHRLVWSLSLREKGVSQSVPQTINYNTYALGRDGYFSLDLITGADSIEGDKGVAKALLGSLIYLPGKRYEDFNASTDKVAAYGLAALVGVVAAKKLGLLAIAGLFLLKAWKLLLLGVAAVVGLWRKFLGRRDAEAE